MEFYLGHGTQTGHTTESLELFVSATEDPKGQRPVNCSPPRGDRRTRVQTSVQLRQ